MAKEENTKDDDVGLESECRLECELKIFNEWMKEKKGGRDTQIHILLVLYAERVWEQWHPKSIEYI